MFLNDIWADLNFYKISLMKKQLLFLTFLFYFTSIAQHRLNFGYDSAGNQTNRAYCFACTSKPAKEIKVVIATKTILNVLL